LLPCEGTRPGSKAAGVGRFGMPRNYFPRAVLLMACLLGVVQFGVVSVFGVVVGDIKAYYGLSESAGHQLYAAINFGSCAMSWAAGICYDTLGPTKTMVLGTALGVLPMFAQLDWSTTFPALDTLNGLRISFLLFGTSEAFFGTVSTFTPLKVFPKEVLGRVSALIQVSSSLGVSVQSEAYAVLKENCTDFVQAYYTYMVVCTFVGGLTMVLAFRDNSELEKAEPWEEVPEAEGPRPSLWSVVLSLNFAYMSLVFFFGIGFVFSYLEAAGGINTLVGLPATRATVYFGLFGALGRVAVNCALDYTGGSPFIYIALGSLAFSAGMFCLVIPSELGASVNAVQGLNLLCGFGGGALLGIAPPALSLLFAPEYLGILYGILYLWVSLAIPIWGTLIPDPARCASVSCYRRYCQVGASANVVVALIGLAMVWVQRKRGSSATPSGILAQRSEGGV